MSESRRIRDPVKRLVRQACGFGCVICGKPLYEYDHMTPYSEVLEHDPNNLVLLCDGHHREKTNNLLPTDTVREARANPINLRRGESHPYDLHYSGERCKADIGSNIHVWPRIRDGMLTVPLIVDDTPLVMFRVEDGHLLLTVQLFDQDNNLLVQIADNELVFSTAPWDVELEARTLTVRAGLGDILVRMTFAPPSGVMLDRAKIFRNGIGIEVKPESVTLPNSDIHMSGNYAQDCILGVAVGEYPPLGAAFSLDGEPRNPFRQHPSVEKRVLRLQ